MKEYPLGHGEGMVAHRDVFAAGDKVKKNAEYDFGSRPTTSATPT